MSYSISHAEHGWGIILKGEWNASPQRWLVEILFIHLQRADALNSRSLSRRSLINQSWSCIFRVIKFSLADSNTLSRVAPFWTWPFLGKPQATYMEVPCGTKLYIKCQKRETPFFPKYHLLMMKSCSKILSVGFLPFVGFIEAITALKHLPYHSTFQFWLSVC